MSFSLIPDYKFKKLEDIKPEFLKERGIKLLLLDLDNTIAPYGESSPSDEMRRWAESIKEEGIVLFIVSNNKGTRPETFSKELDVSFIKLARKPSRRGIRAAMAKTGFFQKETALAGDQIYTDTLAANRAGVTALLIDPIDIRNPLLKIRYWIEIPFRAAAKYYEKKDK